MKTSEITTTNITKSYKNILKKLSSSWGKSQMAFLQDCIYYFKVSGTNPENIEPFSPKIAIENLTKKMDQSIGFFQTHEKKKLQPLLDEMIITHQTLKMTIEYTVTKSDIEEMQDFISQLSDLQERLIILIKESNNRKEEIFSKLKSGFEKTHEIYFNEQKKIQVLIELVFKGLATKSITGGIKQNLIDEFNQVSNSK